MYIIIYWYEAEFEYCKLMAQKFIPDTIHFSSWLQIKPK